MCNISSIQRSVKPSGQRINEEINSYNEHEQLTALESNKGLRSIKRKQCLGTSNIIALKEEDGTLTEDRERMIKRCEESYTDLYSTRRPQDQELQADKSFASNIQSDFTNPASKDARHLETTPAKRASRFQSGILYQRPHSSRKSATREGKRV